MTIRHIVAVTDALNREHDALRSNRRGASKRAKPGPLPKVLGEAVIECDGVQFKRSVELWEILPVGWNQASIEQRRKWLRDYFRAELGLTANQQLVKVEVTL